MHSTGYREGVCTHTLKVITTAVLEYRTGLFNVFRSVFSTLFVLNSHRFRNTCRHSNEHGNETPSYQTPYCNLCKILNIYIRHESISKKKQIIRLIWPVKALSFHYQVLSENAQLDNSGWPMQRSRCINPAIGGGKMCSSPSRAVINRENKIYIWLRFFRAQVIFTSIEVSFARLH